jgi:hypothetical protein
LAERVTRELSGTGAVMPFGADERTVGRSAAGLEGNGFRRRYVALDQPGLKFPCYCVGVRDPFIGHDTPLWLRFHSQTPTFRAIRARLLESEFGAADEHVESGGHFWIPLLPLIGADGDLVIADLVAQAGRVVSAAKGADAHGSANRATPD